MLYAIKWQAFHPTDRYPLMGNFPPLHITLHLATHCPNNRMPRTKTKTNRGALKELRRLPLPKKSIADKVYVVKQE